MDFRSVEAQLKAEYRAVMPRYRRDDEVEVQSTNHRRLWTILRGICLSFPGPLSVLDAGCGTGRYFHCLENVARLTGLDVSPEMLAAAEHPVLAEQITVPQIELVCENVFEARFAPESFDFIYSLGMFGHGCPVGPEICRRFYRWLKPGGKLFFDALSVQQLPLRVRARRKMRHIAYPWLPRSLRRCLDERSARLPLFALTTSDLETILRSTPFETFHISQQTCESPLWDGVHLECLAVKEFGSGA